MDLPWPFGPKVAIPSLHSPEGRQAQRMATFLLVFLIAVAAGLFMAYGARLSASRFLRAAAQFASAGYAVPGAVLAIGVLIPLSRLDAAVDALSQGLLGRPAGYLLTGSIAAVVFGRWQPIGTAAAVLLFAIADAFQIRAQALGIGIPYQFLVILPYVVTLLALALFQRRMRPPSALGIDYRPE